MKEFYSQICTSVEQSKRLLDLMLKPETADMVYTDASLPYKKDEFRLICKEYLQLHKEVNYEISPFTFIPAWSLHRLLCLLYPREDVYPIMPTTAYDDTIDEIENEIKCGGFNKEYLKQ
jgi:uncharacterized protein YozE (UPF0346 family)